MAKMFYTMEETKSALGKNEEEIKQLSREGRLREFRDGNRFMFKADQVEQLKTELGGGDAISLAPAADSGAPIGLAGESGGGSVLGLADSAGARKEDTHFDVGLSGSLGGSVGGIPSPKGTGDSRAGSAAGRGTGITIFDVDESQRADPSAQTSINAAPSDQINLDSVGSGSGLLDLTRESDDTSLGAVFDELTPSAPPRRGAPSIATMETQAAEMPAIDTSARGALTAPIYVERADATSVGLGAASLATALIVCVGGLLMISVLMGYRPGLLESLQLREGSSGLYYMLGAVVVVAGFFIAGLFAGKSAR